MLKLQRFTDACRNILERGLISLQFFIIQNLEIKFVHTGNFNMQLMHQLIKCDVAVIQECLVEHVERAFPFELGTSTREKS
jgi:hypothetical protein